MRTLHTSFRVGDLESSVDFYEKIGFAQVGRVSIRDESILVMLNLPGEFPPGHPEGVTREDFEQADE